MTGALVLFLVPVLLFVTAFLYETWISVRRLRNPKGRGYGYLSATWEVTHTLLVFAVVMLVMMFTQVLEELSQAIFLTTFLAATALGVRAICYIYIFYVRQSKTINWVDYLFSLSHFAAAVFLVMTVAEALWFLYKNNPPANEQFIPFFIPGLILVVGVCLLPMLLLYKTKD